MARRVQGHPPIHHVAGKPPAQKGEPVTGGFDPYVAPHRPPLRARSVLAFCWSLAAMNPRLHVGATLRHARGKPFGSRRHVEPGRRGRSAGCCLPFAGDDSINCASHIFSFLFFLVFLLPPPERPGYRDIQACRAPWHSLQLANKVSA